MRPKPRSLPVLAALVVATGLSACDPPTRVVAASIGAGVADTTFALRVGQEARVGGTMLRIVFLGVDDDSRCPSDVMCVWAGNAAVRIGVTYGTGPTVAYVLNTGIDPRFADLASYRLTLTRLEPDPVSTSRIPAERYVATFRLQRVGYAPD